MWPPAAATPGTFRAELVLPTGVVAWNAFPATLQAARGATASSYTFALPVVPSMFAFNLRSGAAPPLTLAGTLNGFVLLFIAAFCYLIWRQFRAQPA
jgi:hypothetical protein